MSILSELQRDAASAYFKGQYQDAARLHKMAALLAEESGNVGVQHHELVWAALFESALGQFRSALAGFLEARLLEASWPDVKFVTPDTWYTRKDPVAILLRNPSTFPQLMEQLEDCLEYAKHNAVPQHDVSVLLGEMALARGLWSEALIHLEKAASQYSSGEGGSSVATIACLATKACLRSGRLSAARDWASKIGEGTLPYFSKELTRLWEILIEIDLARAEGDALLLESLVMDLDTLPPDIGAVTTQRRLAQFWGTVFAQHSGDPASRDHPARRCLSRSPNKSISLDTWFQYNLAVVDYRIACLRFSVELPQNDDQWSVAAPIAKLHVDVSDDTMRRLKRARIASKGALKRAKHLDGCLECEWRVLDAKIRIDAIDDIAAAFPST